MRYDRVVTFYAGGEPVLNVDTGKYDKTPKVAAIMIANVTEVGTDRQVATFGDIDQTSLTVRLIDTPPKGWSYLMVDNCTKHYRQTTSRTYRNTNMLIVSEVK